MPRCYAVKCLKTGQTWESIKKAARAIGINDTVIQKYLRDRATIQKSIVMDKGYDLVIEKIASADMTKKAHWGTP